jgi:RHS repeat-associated protein
MPQPDPAGLSATRATLRWLPLAFIPNAGQSDAAARFIIRGPSGTLFFTPGELAIALQLRARPRGQAQQPAPDAGRWRRRTGGTSYDPWGQVESGSAPTFGFTGELRDSPSGMVYLRARWYNPQYEPFGLCGSFVSTSSRFAPLAAMEGPPYRFCDSAVPRFCCFPFWLLCSLFSVLCSWYII